MKKIDLTGQKFGRLTVISVAPNHSGRCAWNCVCDCGNEKIIRSEDLRGGKTKSCGCLKRDIVMNRNTKHGKSHTKLAYVWQGMIARCTRKSHISYPAYGGRGISVCKEWSQFSNFHSWATQSGYAEGLTIDRIDTNGDYCPSNCRWISMLEQAHNMRKNITYKGKCIAEWSSELGVSPFSIYGRIKRGWPLEKAIFTPIRPMKKRQ